MDQLEIFNDDIKIASQGKIFCTIVNEDGTTAKMAVRNKVLLTGRSALVSSLANQFDGTFNFYIARILFGSNGTVGGTPRYVDDSRDGLFGPVTLAKPVIASIDPLAPSQVTFTTTVAFGELVGNVINEMALEMATGDLFSMATMGDINKTGTIQLIFNWRANFI